MLCVLNRPLISTRLIAGISSVYIPDEYFYERGLPLKDEAGNILLGQDGLPLFDGSHGLLGDQGGTLLLDEEGNPLLDEGGN